MTITLVEKETIQILDKVSTRDQSAGSKPQVIVDQLSLLRVL